MNFSQDNMTTIVIALLSAGGATFIWTITRSILAFRNSAEGREEKAIVRLEAYERDAREQLAMERAWGSYWYRRAAILDFDLRRRGHEPPPAEPEPTREKS